MELHARNGDPETSHEAMASLDKEKMKGASELAHHLHSTLGPMADYELEQLWPIYWKKPCCDHLHQQARSVARDAGLIRDSGLRKKNPKSNRRQIIWEACDIGPIEIRCCPTCGSVKRR